MSRPCLLVLEDGAVFHGRSFGAEATVAGEVVFNTAMTGYQEVLTDPSYRRQLVCMTAPHIGNYGTCAADAESPQVQASALLVRQAARLPSNWRSQRSLGDELIAASVPGMEELDTRRLVRHLRSRGAMRGALSTDITDVERLRQLALDAPSPVGLELAGQVGEQRDRVLEPLGLPGGMGDGLPDDMAAGAPAGMLGGALGGPGASVVVYDFGAKEGIVRSLQRAGMRVRVVPATTPADDVVGWRPDGVVLSNGPGDPAAASRAIATTAALLGRLPIFGICLGHQLLAQAVGARTTRLPFGHRGVNQPVVETATGRVLVTSHNHGFAVEGESLPPSARVSHRNANDAVVEGIELPSHQAFSVQFHPEAAPGPHDAAGLFARFAELMHAAGTDRGAHGNGTSGAGRQRSAS